MSTLNFIRAQMKLDSLALRQWVGVYNRESWRVVIEPLVQLVSMGGVWGGPTPIDKNRLVSGVNGRKWA